MNSQKIKMMYVLTGLHTGGAETLLRDLLRKLDRERFEPIIVSIVPVGKIGKEIKQAGDKVVTLNIKKKWNFLLMFWSFLSLIKREKPQIIHAHLFHAIFLTRLVKLFNKKIKIISTIHNENIGGRSREVILRITGGLSNVTNTISQRVSQIMINKKAVKKNKIITIFNGIDPEKFYPDPEKGQEIKKELNIEDNSPVLISVGRLTRAKGFFYLIKVVKKLRDKYLDIVLLVLGEGEEREKLEKQVRDLGLENNVFLLGNKSNVNDYLNTADIFVSSSLWEGLPTVILEAMACQLPVVATDVGGTREMVKEACSGFLIEPENPQVLSDKIDRLLSSPQKEKMGEQGREVVKGEFSLETMVDNYQKLYLNLCKKVKK